MCFVSQENTNGGGESGPDAAGFEGAPQSALVSVETFLRTSRESLRSHRAIEDAWLWRDAMESGCDLTGDRITGVVAIGEDDSIVGHGGVSGNGRAGENTNTDRGASSGGAMSLQKKVEGVGSGLNPESEVYLDGFDSMALALRDMAEDVDRAGIRTDTDTNRRPPGLVVIASLVDKIPNLAGLARTCEVLGAEALVMADRDRTVSHKDFTAVSVTAEQWLPIRDVSIAGLVPYLLTATSRRVHVGGPRADQRRGGRKRIRVSGKFILIVVWAISMTSFFVHRQGRRSCWAGRGRESTRTC